MSLSLSNKVTSGASVARRAIPARETLPPVRYKNGRGDPVAISKPHGGRHAPSSLPDRHGLDPPSRSDERFHRAPRGRRASPINGMRYSARSEEHTSELQSLRH